MERERENGTPVVLRAAILALIALAVLPAAVHARPGALDRSFGENGKLVKAVDLEPAAWDSAATAMAKLPEGVTVVLAGRTLLAVRPDGRLARRFGGGRVEVAMPPGGTLRLSDLAAAPEGRVIVAGVFASAAAADHSDPVGEQLFVARYRPDGSLDPTFGSGGTLVTTAGQSPPRQVAPVEEETWAAPRLKLGGIAVDADGRIVLTGSRLDFVATCRVFFPFYPFHEAFVARLGEAGGLDPTFGEGGATPLSDAEAVAAPLLTGRGGVYLSARPRFACFPPSDFGLAIRLGANGLPVSTFGVGGRVEIPEEQSPAPIAPAMDAAGRVLLPGVSIRWEAGSGDPTSGRSIALVRRILPGGEVDPGFGEQGAAALGVPGRSFSPAAIAVDSRGRIVVAGTSSPPGPEAASSVFALGRLTGSGRVDGRFGRRGVLSTGFGARSQARATSMALVSGGDILLAGTLASPSLGGGEGLAMGRYASR